MCIIQKEIFEIQKEIFEIQKKEVIVANRLLHICGLLPSNQILPQCFQFLGLSGQPWLLGTFVNC